MFRLRHWLPLVGIVALSLVVSVGSAAADIRKHFVITDCKTNKPIAGAQIKALDAVVTAGSASEATTGVEGFCELFPLRFEGTHRFEISAEGYQTKSTPPEELKAGTTKLNQVCLDQEVAPQTTPQEAKAPTGTPQPVSPKTTPPQTEVKTTPPKTEIVDKEVTPSEQKPPGQTEIVKKEVTPSQRPESTPESAPKGKKPSFRPSPGIVMREAERLGQAPLEEGGRRAPITAPHTQSEDDDTEEIIGRIGKKLRSQTRKPGGGTKPRGGKRIGETRPRELETAPGGPPTTTYTTQVTDEPAACEVNRSLTHVAFPDPKEYLEPPPKGQPAHNHPAMGARRVHLFDQSYIETKTSLVVPSVGIDFRIIHTYRSNIKTEEGGVYGYNMDFNYYKRLIALGGHLGKNVLRVEDLRAAGSVNYLAGNGRLDEFKPKRTLVQRVNNFNKSFKAVVTYYKPPPGLFAELERYAVLPGYDLPFEKHPNFEGRMFYVMRYKNGYREIFSCRGMLLYIEDRHQNQMTFLYEPIFNPLTNKYELIFHPLTNNLLLTKIQDTAGRNYEVEWVRIEEGDVRTNYKGVVITGKFPKMRLKIVKEKYVKDPKARSVEFRYRGFNSVPVLEKIEEHKDGTFVTGYTYSEHKDRYYLETVTLPRENKKGGGAVLTNKWKEDGDVKRVERQTIGRWHTATRRSGWEGGRLVIRSKKLSPKSQMVTVIRSEGHPLRYKVESAGSEEPVITQIDESLGNGGVATTKFQYNDSGQVTQVERPEGNLTIFDYEGGNSPVLVEKGLFMDCVTGCTGGPSTYLNNLAKGNLKKKTLRAGKKKNPLEYNDIVIRYDYEPLYNQIRRIHGPGSAVTEFEFDYSKRGTEGNPIVKKHPTRTTADGRTLTNITTQYTYTLKGLLATIEDPKGHKTVYGYNKTGYLTSAETPDGIFGFGRDGRGNMTKYTDPRGTVTTFEVNARNLVVEEIRDAEGFKNKTTYRYDANGNRIETKVLVEDNFPKGALFRSVPRSGFILTNSYEYNLVNLQTRISQKAKGLSRETTYAYDTEAKLIFVTLPEGGTREYKYDAQGNLIEKIVGGELRETYRYDKNGNLVSKKRGKTGGTYTYESDGFDRPYKETTPLGTKIVTYLNPGGTNKYTRIDGKNHKGAEAPLRFVEFTQDEFEAVIRTDEHIYDPNGKKQGTRTRKYVRDEEGKLTKVIDSNGNETVFEHDGHRQVKVNDPMGNSVTYKYDAGGNPVSITEEEKEILYSVSNAGRLKRETKTAGYTVKMEHDSLGRMTALTDVGGHALRYAYNALGNRRAMRGPGGRLDIYQLDAFGRRVGEKQFANLGRDSIVISQKHDLLDRLVTSSMKRGRIKVSGIKRAYTAAGLLKTLQAEGRSHSYKYDDRGNRIEETLPNGVKIRTEYDAEDRRTSVTSDYPGSSVGRSSSDFYAYDGLGRVTKAGRYNGLVTNKMAYNSLGNLVQDEQIFGGHKVRLEYKYNKRGLRKQFTAPEISSDLGETTFKYAYDPIGRVTKIDRIGPHWPYPKAELRYEYSGVSRRARRTIGGTEHTFYRYNRERGLREHRVFSERYGGHLIARVLLNYDVNHRLVRQSSRLSFPGRSKDEEVSLIQYTPWGARARRSATNRSEERPTKKKVLKSLGGSRRLYQYDDGRLSTIYSYIESLTDVPGELFGRNQANISSGNKISFRYEGNQIKQARFHRYGNVNLGISDVVGNFMALLFHGFDSYQRDLEGGLSDDQIKGAMAGDASLFQTSWFKYDKSVNLIENNRLRYQYDNRNLLSRVTDKWNFGRNFNMTATYYYDYANRLVYVEYGPRAARKYFKAVFPNKRIIYDGRLPYAELRADPTGKPGKADVVYVTHPEGTDIGSIRLRTHYDRRGAKAREPRWVLPFLDHRGALTHVFDPESGRYAKVGYLRDSVVRTDARRKHAVLPKPKKDMKPENRFALRPEQPRREIPLTSLLTRWEPFSEQGVQLESGQFVFNHSRNFQREFQEAKRERSEYLQEAISEVQEAGLIAMGLTGGIIVLPAALLTYPWITVGIIALDIAIDYAVTEVALDKDYTTKHLLTTLAFTGAFAGGGVLFKQFRHLKSARLLESLELARKAKAARALADEAYVPMEAAGGARALWAHLKSLGDDLVPPVGAGRRSIISAEKGAEETLAREGLIFTKPVRYATKAERQMVEEAAELFKRRQMAPGLPIIVARDFIIGEGKHVGEDVMGLTRSVSMTRGGTTQVIPRLVVFTETGIKHLPTVLDEAGHIAGIIGAKAHHGIYGFLTSNENAQTVMSFLRRYSPRNYSSPNVPQIFYEVLIMRLQGAIRGGT
ncbi:MAG: hypothetical protein ACE5JS_02550 [Nitrospinota bacterium]